MSFDKARRIVCQPTRHFAFLGGGCDAVGSPDRASAPSAPPAAVLQAHRITQSASSLRVSHWSVYSDATVKLIRGGISTMAADKSVGRAEAMRQSMLALIDRGKPFEAHPSYWAPFVVVGEGAAAR